MAELPRVRLGVNIDHVATLRNARGGVHPDPVRAAKAAIAAGADGITFHLREDRRHIRDQDVQRLKEEIAAPLNFEMAATAEMARIALATKPQAVCLVPERREERTTEGGLDVAGQHNVIAPLVQKFSDAGIRASLFIAADLRQIEAAAKLRAPVIEIHVGAWCEAAMRNRTAEVKAELVRIESGARQAAMAGIEVHAGHGLDYATAETICAVPQIAELNIGHFIIGESVFEGLAVVLGKFRKAMDRGRRRAGGRAA